MVSLKQRLSQPEIVLAAGVYGLASFRGRVVHGLTPDPSDLIVDNTRYSAFHETGLAQTLRARGVTLVAIAGVTTNMCLESTVRDAFTLDFKVVVLEDCVGAPEEIMQRGPLESFGYGFGDVISGSDWRDALAAEPKRC